MNKHYREVKIGSILFLVCTIVFYSSFKYGFAQDDFDGLSIETWSQLWDTWKRALFRRPINEFFYFSFYKMFGYNPIPYRLLIFGVYFVNTFLTCRLVRSLTKNQIIGFLVAILFAANTVQFRNIYAICDNLILFTTMFYLVAALLFLNYLENNNKKNLLISFSVASVGLLIAKEDLITFPLIAILLSVHTIFYRKNYIDKKDILPIIHSTALFWTIPFLFIIFRSVMVLRLGGETGCPYNLLNCFSARDSSNAFKVSFAGIHIFKNLARQVFWNLGSLGIYWLDKPFNKNAGNIEWHNPGGIEYFLIFGFLAGLVFFYWKFRKSTSWWYLILGIVWFVGTLLPTLVLPKHVYPHYSAFSSIGLFLAFLIPFRTIADFLSKKVVLLVGVIAVMLYLTNSLYWMYVNEQTNWIIIHSALVKKWERDIKRMYPFMPSNKNLIFLNINPSLFHCRMPKLWYEDSTLNLYCDPDFILKEGKVYSKTNMIIDRANTFVFVMTGGGFREVTPQFFAKYEGTLPVN